VKFHFFGHVALIAPDHLKGIGAFEEEGELLVCGDQAGKGDMEPLEEFWKRSRLMPREDLTEVLDVGVDTLWTEI
jgi:hypothetical protein